MKPFVFQFSLLLACVVLVGPAQAEKADRQKPMNIEADTLRYDDIKQTSVFTGRVGRHENTHARQALFYNFRNYSTRKHAKKTSSN